MEIGGVVNIRCPNTGLHADIDFIVKGYFSGTHNAVGGTIFRSAQPDTKGAPKDVIYNIEGNWHKQVFLRVPKAPDATLLFDYAEATNPFGQCLVTPEQEQDPNSSRQLWRQVAEAVSKNQQDIATQHKTAIEEYQRKLRKEREERGEVWTPKLFTSNCVKDDEDQQFLGAGALKFPQ